jgi:L-proline amide hydrolase
MPDYAEIPAPIRTGTIPFQGHSTWFRISGGESATLPPLVVLHGGPGALHDYTLRFAHLASPQRAVIHYDQLGCGRSTHLPDAPKDFWTVELFLAELDNLLKYLAISDAYHLLGQSWGGMLGAEHAVLQPAGLKSLTIANSPASMALWLSEANRLRADLPPDVQATLLKHETENTTDDPAYEAATAIFYARHVCRLLPHPPEVKASFDGIAADPTVYHTMNGPSEFHCIGTIKDWSIIDRLTRIQAPTLLISGEFDEATPAVVQPFADNIKGAVWKIIPDASHLSHVEQPELTLGEVATFLSAHD